MNSVQLDIPVANETEDYFQRYEFSRRIAGIINSGHFSKSLVIGIYGKWGEGKSSVLNFIGKEIDSKSARINFNPWYFREDQSLVKSFFESIAAEVGKKLKSKKDAAISAFENYGESVGAVANTVHPGLGAVFNISKKIASSFKNDSLEHYKKRVSDILREADMDFVVFIDDIDRLSIEEIQSVFKLVKLVGDFPRFTYVMAFDDALVAASLGHKFGDRESKDGYDFLEKIIQLPLTLPKASRHALRKYCLDQINKSLDDVGVHLNDHETRNFLGKFDAAFIPGLKNPRLAVRYANAISFAIPLLKGEVNLSDLMIIEAFKVFYPEFYYFIRQRSDIFLTFYGNPKVAERNMKEKAIKLINAKLEECSTDLAVKIREMLWSLFPQLNGLYNNIFYNVQATEDWYRDKRVCSAYYFERYFSYSVQEGDISDVYFKQLFTDVDKITTHEFAARLEEELQKFDISSFVFKVGLLIDTFSAAEVSNLYLVFSMLGNQFPLQERFQLSRPIVEMAKIIRGLIAKQSRDLRVDLCLRSLAASSPMNFTLALFNSFVDKTVKLFELIFLHHNEAILLGDEVIRKYELDYDAKNALYTYPEEDLRSIFEIYDSLGKLSSIKTQLLTRQSDPRDSGFSIKMVRIFTPTVYSTQINEPYKTVFDQNGYGDLKRFIDSKLIYDSLIKNHGKISYAEERKFSPGDLCTDQDLIIAFQRIYENDTSSL